MNDQFDAAVAEIEQLNILTDDHPGVFTVPKKSLLRFWGKPERTFRIDQPYAGTLDYLSREYKGLDIDENGLKTNWFEESKRIVAQNTYRYARIVAIAVLRDQWKIRWLTTPLAYYFLWRITPSAMANITKHILLSTNYADFIDSIRFLSLQKRTTAPALMENPGENPGENPVA